MAAINTIRIYCDAPSQRCNCFMLSVYDESEKLMRCEEIIPNEYHTLELSCGCFRVCVRSNARHSPGAICKWVDLTDSKTQLMCFIFRTSERKPPFRRINVRLVDAIHPGIIPINGGTTWQILNIH